MAAQFFVKFSNIKCHKNLSSNTELFNTNRQMDVMSDIKRCSTGLQTSPKNAYRKGAN
jgi:hypothetical protein